MVLPELFAIKFSETLTGSTEKGPRRAGKFYGRLVNL